jgi:adenylate cyclase
MIDYYNRGLALYKKMQFKEALAYFNKALEFEPTDGPTKLYIDRCKGYILNPPDQEWDGVHTAKEK